MVKETMKKKSNSCPKKKKKEEIKQNKNVFTLKKTHSGFLLCYGEWSNRAFEKLKEREVQSRVCKRSKCCASVFHAI